jgi:hypothetical protein
MVVGGEADDNIQVVPSSGVTICGFPLSPPIYNGWRIDIEGGIGNDSITAGTGPGNLYAEYSDDLAETNHSRIYTFNSTATLTGADGSDIFYVYSTSPLMYIVGQGGDDFFVMPKVGSNNVEFADGGSGSDRFYGARAVNITGMEWFFGQGVL